jgi:hypothetical protein
MEPEKTTDSTSKAKTGVHLKDVSGLLALAVSVFTTFGFVTRFLSFRWSPVFSIRHSALTLTTLTSPIDWLVVGVTNTLLAPLPWLGGLLAGIFGARWLNSRSPDAVNSQGFPSEFVLKVLLAILSLSILALCVFKLDARSFLVWGLPLVLVNLFMFKQKLFVNRPLWEGLRQVGLPLACLMLWLALAGGFSGSVGAAHEKITIDGEASFVIVIADNSDVVSFIRCSDKTRALTTVERGTISERVVLPFVTKRDYPTIAKLVSKLLHTDGLEALRDRSGLRLVGIPV